MDVVVGIDLGSTTTKAVLLDSAGVVVGRGITNSRSNYEVACTVARREALTSARFELLERAVGRLDGSLGAGARGMAGLLHSAFRLELHLAELDALAERVLALLDHPHLRGHRDVLEPAAHEVVAAMREAAPALFMGGAPRKSDFFRDLAGAAFIAEAERLAAERAVPFDRLVGLFDRAILDIETSLRETDFAATLAAALDRAVPPDADPLLRGALEAVVREVGAHPVNEVAFVGTGYGRQTLPFPAAAIRSEILCHGRGAHRVFPETRTVLDIGGQDTKAIQVDGNGVVTSFQMNDRCAAGCGRYLGYIADELNLGLHELGPLALKAKRVVRVNSTCTVFAGAELRERLALGEAREDILAGLHRAIMLRAMSLLARSGGVSNEFTFTGGVCKNPMATKLLTGLVVDNYGADIRLNAHADSIYMGALGAALFASEDLAAGAPNLLPEFVPSNQAPQLAMVGCDGCASEPTCEA